MTARPGRVLLLVLGLGLLFGGVAAVTLRIMPGPLRDTDYLVVGTLATFALMAVLFIVLITTWIKTPDVFFRRQKPPE
jgi:hypothetical protein